MQARSKYPLHPRQIAYHERMAATPHDRKVWRGNPGCYGICCGEGTRGGYVCVVCHRYDSNAHQCCGYYTVHVNPRIRVPSAHAKGRWKQFVKRFPQFRFRESLKHTDACALCAARAHADSAPAATTAPEHLRDGDKGNL
jgi:hypothetical protein